MMLAHTPNTMLGWISECVNVLEYTFFSSKSSGNMAIIQFSSSCVSEMLYIFNILFQDEIVSSLTN